MARQRVTLQPQYFKYDLDNISQRIMLEDGNM